MMGETDEADMEGVFVAALLGSEAAPRALKPSEMIK